MRMLTISSVFMALASAFMLYGLNYDTRVTAAHVQSLERRAEKARTDISVLKAERALLARPERIEPLARAQGLGPATESQLERAQAPADIETGSNKAP
jgi:cell division protein FtsL